jgi:hypothetical protein
MSRSRKSLARAGSAAVCACTLAAGLVVVPDVAAPPSAAPPTVALAAAPKPLAASAPELIAHMPQFATLVGPLVSENVAPQQYSSATANTGMATSVVGTTIANGVFRVAAVAIRSVIAVLSPFVNAPVIGQPIGAAIIITLFGGGLAAAAAVSVILRIDEAVSSLVGFIGSALGRLVRLPGALLSGATGLAGAATEPGPAPRIAGASAVDVRSARTADEPDIQDPAPSPSRHADAALQAPPADPPKDDPEPPAADPTPVTPDVTEPSTGDTPTATKAPEDTTKPSASPVKPRTKVRHAHGDSDRTTSDSNDPSPSHKKRRTAPSRPEAPSSTDAPATADTAAS